MRILKLFVLLVTLSLVLTACETPEPENASERPWNTQRGWEGALPTTINQGR